MSRYIDIFKNNGFISFGDALDNFIANMGINRVWLCEKIHPDKKEAASFNTQISRWIRTKSNPNMKSLRAVNEVLYEFYHVTIINGVDGKWIYDQCNTPVVLDSRVEYTTDWVAFEKMLDKLDLQVSSKEESSDVSIDIAIKLLKIGTQIIELKK